MPAPGPRPYELGLGQRARPAAHCGYRGGGLKELICKACRVTRSASALARGLLARTRIWPQLRKAERFVARVECAVRRYLHYGIHLHVLRCPVGPESPPEISRSGHVKIGKRPDPWIPPAYRRYWIIFGEVLHRGLCRARESAPAEGALLASGHGTPLAVSVLINVRGSVALSACV